MNNNVSANCCSNNGDSTVWILILILLFCNGSCGFNLGNNGCNSCGMDSLIIIFFLFFIFGGNGLF